MWSRVYYWIIIVLPIVAFGVLAANGRWREFWSLFQHPDAATEEAFQRSFTTALIWSLSTLPISLTAWYLGRRHTAARRINFEVVVGFREIFRRAIGRDLTPRQLEAMARPPKDRVGIALLLGIVVALLVPAFFLVFMPILRTPRGAVWLGGAGILIGATIYCQRRASAYLIDEPEAFDPFSPVSVAQRGAIPDRRSPFRSSATHLDGGASHLVVGGRGRGIHEMNGPRGTGAA